MNQAKCNLKAAENFPSYLDSYLRNRNEAYFTGFSVFLSTLWVYNASLPLTSIRHFSLLIACYTSFTVSIMKSFTSAAQHIYLLSWLSLVECSRSMMQRTSQSYTVIRHRLRWITFGLFSQIWIMQMDSNNFFPSYKNIFLGEFCP